MGPLSSIRARLEAAGDPAATLSAAGDAFELIRQIADGCAVPATNTFATWAWVTVAACEGRDALGGSPAAPLPGTDRADGKATSEDRAAEISNLAVTLRERLHQGAANQAASPEDQRAFQRAASAAGQIRELLAVGG